MAGTTNVDQGVLQAVAAAYDGHQAALRALIAKKAAIGAASVAAIKGPAGDAARASLERMNQAASALTTTTQAYGASIHKAAGTYTNSDADNVARLNVNI